MFDAFLKVPVALLRDIVVVAPDTVRFETILEALLFASYFVELIIGEYGGMLDVDWFVAVGFPF